MTMNMFTPPPAGISSLGLRLPPLVMDVGELAALRAQDPDKYRIGLGCRGMSLCPTGYDVVDLAVAAAERALDRWSGDASDLGLIAVGTETAKDMSRPLSAWVAERLGLRGAVRSYEVKHACYGGTLALRQALEWRMSGAAQGKSALVIASDVALYEPGDPGEPTQGAGAVAMVVGEPTAATVDAASYAYSEPAFDFWRPVGQPFPSVDGKLSLDCYGRAAEHCFRSWLEAEGGSPSFDDIEALCFHVPFPKMVKKAALRVGGALGLTEADALALFEAKVAPWLEWNRSSGNAYTASLWISVAQALAGRQEGARLAAFSYGSGFGAELLTLRAGPDAHAGAWAEDFERDLADQASISARDYSELRAAAR